MSKNFVKPSDPILTKVAKEIPKDQINSSQTRKIVESMFEVAHGQQKNKRRPVMVGLAAPQIGISKRIILVDLKADGIGKVGDLRVYINPQIIWKSKKEGEWYEGCYSTGRVCGIVKRPVFIKVKAYTMTTMSSLRKQGSIKIKVNWIPAYAGMTVLKWALVEEKFSGYMARVFQHEIDHLNGKVFVDHIKDPDKLHWVLKKEFPLYRNKKAWRNWPKKCSFEKWKKIKNPLLRKA